ncbi:MAG: hypothetical protein SH818_06525 [Saprospiraceae bacterium]|nr:hypothetical protein [Saprospiraceae bacterium]
MSQLIQIILLFTQGHSIIDMSGKNAFHVKPVKGYLRAITSREINLLENVLQPLVVRIIKRSLMKG